MWDRFGDQGIHFLNVIHDDADCFYGVKKLRHSSRLILISPNYHNGGTFTGFQVVSLDILKTHGDINNFSKYKNITHRTKLLLRLSGIQRPHQELILLKKH